MVRTMGRRSRNKRGAEREPVASTDYTDADGNVLTLRDRLSAGTARKLEKLDLRPAATADDRWQRRGEFLFERLTIRWVIAGLPIDDQKGLLGRYRMASADERRRIRETIDAHVERHQPELSSDR